jgi:hypothetical protein
VGAVPWCDDCSKYWTPNSLPPDGTCPTCGEVIADPPDDRVPWHFWILVVGVTVYLGWRLVQLFQWLVGNGHAVWAILLGVVCAALVAWGVVALWRREDPADGTADSSADRPAA